MNDLVAWALMAGMAGYGFLILGVVRLVERRRTRGVEAELPAAAVPADLGRPGVPAGALG